MHARLVKTPFFSLTGGLLFSSQNQKMLEEKHAKMKAKALEKEEKEKRLQKLKSQVLVSLKCKKMYKEGGSIISYTIYRKKCIEQI